jgi:hypothetical protein
MKRERVEKYTEGDGLMYRPILDNNSKRKPDIALFDKAFAFAESKGAPFSAITLIEFKKTQRNDYDDKDNPFYQVAGYAQIIRSGKAKYTDGRSMNVNSAVPIYAYIVCDLTSKLDWWAKMAGLKKTTDGLGYVGYMSQFEIYAEVISYEKVLRDTEKRHLAFFEKLGISVNYDVD